MSHLSRVPKRWLASTTPAAYVLYGRPDLVCQALRPSRVGDKETRMPEPSRSRALSTTTADISLTDTSLAGTVLPARDPS